MAGGYTHTSEAGLIIFLPLMYCTPPPTLLDTNTLKRMVGGNSPPPNLQHCETFCNRLADQLVALLRVAVSSSSIVRIINSMQRRKKNMIFNRKKKLKLNVKGRKKTQNSKKDKSVRSGNRTHDHKCGLEHSWTPTNPSLVRHSPPNVQSPNFSTHVESE